MRSFKALSVASIASVCLISCVKLAESPDDEANACTLLENVTIETAKTAYLRGEEMTLRAAGLPDYTNVILSREGKSSEYNPEYMIGRISKFDEGLYVLSTFGIPDCETKNDSIYITVTNPPAETPCQTTPNTVTMEGTFTLTSPSNQSGSSTGNLSAP
ncbi:hypothetical protein [Flavihumibacter petaseus]|uniref:Lipoprotein n=1 Tax=Flavihumibacter petaseus NBRC 106054 TaxID=1220578 RepID=A0A0E9N4B0_9BACT|nr:hypothetical protein [Flavihumibacter petaseus]GAO44664.1 hypothetical protein FPE01S_03_07030 [Flavihumibacter petaseus NBRC 106054]